MASTWQEYNVDIGYKKDLGTKAAVLTGINYYNYNNPVDNNGDNFTDVTIQNRISIFQKWSIRRMHNRLFSLAGRYLYEDRWGGEMDWNSDYRGSTDIYGESIYTSRWEIIGKYQLPIEEKIFLSFSYNTHDQSSYYGAVAYKADQTIGFGQLTWDKAVGKHDLLLGSALRYTFYDDNTPATADPQDESNRPDKILLPGLFVQDDITLHEKHKMLLGMRYDYNSIHGNIFTPRLAYKFSLNENNIFRLNAGTGFRVVNLFTEDHAALTGSREVVIVEALKPEKSYNLNLNYIKKMTLAERAFIDIEGTVWYTRFSNQILPDYETDPNKIIYDNLDGKSITRGVTLNVDVAFLNGLKVLGGASLIDVYTINENSEGVSVRRRPVLTEKWTGTYAVTLPVKKLNLILNYTGNIYGRMRLPLLGPLDPRSEVSPWWSIQNLQVTWSKREGSWEVYGGIKNLLNFTPPSNSIARAHDPFDKLVEYEVNEHDRNKVQVKATPENPYALTFDPAYVYAPNQGIRGFFGVR